VNHRAARYYKFDRTLYGRYAGLEKVK
jgi:hypothetical protein